MKKQASALATLALAAGAVIGLSVPAHAASAAVACVRTAEVCRVELKAVNGTVKVGTGFAGISSTTHYQVSKGLTGANICSGSMGFNTTKSCSLGSYRGVVTFSFFKGQNNVGNISIQN